LGVLLDRYLANGAGSQYYRNFVWIIYKLSSGNASVPLGLFRLGSGASPGACEQESGFSRQPRISAASEERAVRTHLLEQNSYGDT
jgi:hypothetical protein